jgi:hypothetical protein
VSLLTTRAPHVVWVQPRARAKNARGVSELVEVGPRVRVRCSVQGAREWSTEEETHTRGLQVLSIRRIFSKTWPGDVNALVYHQGMEFESVGDPVQQNMSRNTSHWSVTVRWIGADAHPELNVP